jgi:hypothetical protein
VPNKSFRRQGSFNQMQTVSYVIKHRRLCRLSLSQRQISGTGVVRGAFLCAQLLSADTGQSWYIGIENLYYGEGNLMMVSFRKP